MKLLLSSNKQIIKNYLKPNSKIGFIPTASEIDTDRWYMEKDKKGLIDMGYNLEIIEISTESIESILNKFNEVDAIFVAGGNAFYLLQQLKMKDVISDLIEFANNKLYIGASAGSCIASPSLDYLEILDNKNEAPNLTDYSSLNFINGYILPHYKSDEEYSKLIDKTVENNKDLNFIILTNEQAVIVDTRDNYKIVNTD